MKTQWPDINKELFLRLAEGDQAAFREIVYSCREMLLPAATRLAGDETLAKDILQEVFLKLWLKRAELTSINNPGGWLRVVMANTASNFVKARLRYELHIQEASAGVGDMQEGFLHTLDAKFIQNLVNEAVEMLPPKRRRVWVLHERQGLSRKEIALEMNISEHTVRNQLIEATAFIQDYLRQNGSALLLAAILLSGEIS